MSERPLLKLAMMVKNEAHTLARTLRSVHPFIGSYLILDTGSTDGTQELVRRELADLPGTIVEEPFVDFATSRNRMLELAGDDADFILWLDADDELAGGEALCAFLREAAVGQRPYAYCVQIVTAGAVFDSARVLKRGYDYSFVGVVHEVLVSPTGDYPGRIPDVSVIHTVDEIGGARTRQRWVRDAELLGAARNEDPHNTRTAFYYALTLSWLDRHEEAIEAFAWRLRLGGWDQEVFCAMLNRARCAARAGRPWSEVLGMYLDAHAYRPSRAEPLYDIAMHYDRVRDHANAFLFARRAWELPVSLDPLFVERHIHERGAAADLVASHAYYLGEFEVGAAAAEEAVALNPGDERMARNLAFYAQRSAAA